jgi:hypothetical protein
LCLKFGDIGKRMATMKPIFKSTLTPSTKRGNLKRKLEDIDPIDEIEEPKSMIFLHDQSFCRVIMLVIARKYWLT